MKQHLYLFKKPFIFFKKQSLKKKIVFLSIFILLLLFSFLILRPKEDKGYVIEPVKRADITEYVSETGNISSTGNITVTSPSTGIIDEVFIRNGSIVTKDDPLFSVKSAASEQEQAAALSNYLTAKTVLDAALATAHSLRATMFTEWDEFKNLATNDTYENEDGTPKEDQRTSAEFNTEKEEWLAAEAKYKNQQAVVSQAQVQVNSTWLLYQATQNATVKALADGVIANLSVASGDSVTEETDTVLNIVSNPQFLTVVIPINETDIAKISEGDSAIIKIDAINDESFNGIVGRIDKIGTNNQGVISYNVYVSFPNTDSRIRKGMTVNVNIQTKTAKNVLSVPNSAVKLYQGRRVVQVLDSRTKELKYIPIKIGIRGEERTEIIEGLSENQEIVIALTNEKLQRQGFFGF